MTTLDIVIRITQLDFGDHFHLRGAELQDFAATLYADVLHETFAGFTLPPAAVAQLDAVRVTCATKPGYAYLDPEADGPLALGARWDFLEASR